MKKTFFFLLFLFLSNFFLYAKKSISIKEFGVDGVDYKNEYQIDKYNRYLKIKSAFEYCLAKEFDLFFPRGTYDVGDRNFPFRTKEDLATDKLLDCHGMMIYGEKGTVFKTHSRNGADVLQLNKIKNLKIKNVEITADLEGFTMSGSNGISITNGFDNIFLENIKIYNLPSVDKTSYIDGGKALTLQFSKGSKSYKGLLIAKNININNCPYGFRMDGADICDVLDKSVNNIDLFLDLTINNTFQGFSIQFGSATKNIGSQEKLKINAKALIKNSQQFVRLSRVLGGDFNFRVVKDKSFVKKKWSKSDSMSFAFLGNYVKNLKMSINGNVGVIQNKIILGAVGSIVEPYNLGNKTENSYLNIDVQGISLEKDFKIIEYNGDSISNTTVNLTDRTLDKNIHLKLGITNKLNVTRKVYQNKSL